MGQISGPPAAQAREIFTKNLDLLGQPVGGGLRSGHDRFNNAGYRGGARPPVQNICAASSDTARSFCLYRYRARSGYNDLVDHAHECYRRDVLAIGLFGRRLAQILYLCRTICWNQKFPRRPTFGTLDLTLRISQIAAQCRMAALAIHHRLGDIGRKFQSRFQFICCKDLTSGELSASSCNRTGS